MKDNKANVAFIGRHLVPYHTPIYKGIANSEKFNLTVIYLSDIGIKPIWDEEFMGNIVWDCGLLQGYDYKILKNVSKNETAGGFMSRFNPGLLLELHRSRYDVVVIQGYSTASDWLALLISKVRGIKVIWRGEVTDRRGITSWKSIVNTILIKLYLGLCDKILYSCSGNYKYLSKYVRKEKDLSFFPCAVDNEYYSAKYRECKINREALRTELGIGANDVVIMTSGRLIERKKPMDLVKAVKAMDNIENIVLLFVGGGPQEKNINNACTENNIRVKTTGFVNQDETTKYYSIGDIYVQLSKYDPSPKAINEAMNFALPIVATKEIGTSKDLVENGFNGYLIDAGDIVRLSDYLTELTRERKKREYMGSNSENIIKKWSIENDVAALEKVVNSINLKRMES